MKYRVVGVRMIDEDLVYVTLEALIDREEPVVTVSPSSSTTVGVERALMNVVNVVMDKVYGSGLYANIVMTLDEFHSSEIEVGSVVDLSLKLVGGE